MAGEQNEIALGTYEFWKQMMWHFASDTIHFFWLLGPD